MPNPIFGGGDVGDQVGSDGLPAYGQQDKFIFNAGWVVGDLWQILFTASAQGNFTIGSGVGEGINISLALSDQTPIAPTVCFTYRNRVYVGFGSQFSFSDNGDPTGWEEQAPGAGFVPYLSQLGNQDAITALSQLQGRLAVIARRSIQLWTVDADPNNFALVQTLDN